MTAARSIPARPGHRGSALVIVLWVTLGLVSVGLYFGHEVSLGLKAADQRVAGIEADQALDAGARYAMHVLARNDRPATLPDPVTYRREGVELGEARFWFLGRTTSATLTPVAPDQPVFALVDECGKLNLNTATADMLANLPRMTPELAAAILDWRDADGTVTTGGAEDETYQRRTPPSRCKNAPFESVEELQRVAGLDRTVLFGEDANLNGVLDPNERDGDATPPSDNRDNRLDPGLLEYLTVSSQEPLALPDGTARINLGQASGRQQLASLLQERLGADRGNQVLRAVGNGAIRSVLEFFIRSRMTADEFRLVETNLVVATGNTAPALVNVNTAPEAVLACLPGIGLERAPQLVGYRQSNAGRLDTVAWVAEVLDAQAAVQAGPYLTGHSFQYSADVAATGRHGRGYRRARFLIDVSGATPRVVARRDLAGLGWALGRTTREQLDLLPTRNPR